MDRELFVLVLEEGTPVEVQHYVSDGHMTESPNGQHALRELARLSRDHPDAFIAWHEKELAPFLSPLNQWPDLLRHPLEILHLSCFQRCNRMVETLGLVDFSSPFLLPGPTDRRFVTWLISPMAGIARADLLNAVGMALDAPSLAVGLFSLGYEATKWGVCAYSEPSLLVARIPSAFLSGLQKPLPNAELGRLIRLNYGFKWLLFWLLGCLLFRLDLPLSGLLAGARRPTLNAVDHLRLDQLRPVLSDQAVIEDGIDVVIPTLGRSEHVLNLLDDLCHQTLPPSKVIIVEQMPAGVQPVLADLTCGRTWPFELHIHTTERIGACHARNLAINDVTGDWVLFLDDDVRLRPRLLAYLTSVAHGYGVDAANAAVYEHEQAAIDIQNRSVLRIWHTFGSGSSLVSARLVQEVEGFDEQIEGGFGEDAEYGVRLRLHGGNVLYASGEPVLHLKAPSGGFRFQFEHPWRHDEVQPIPSPTILYSRNKHATSSMRNGYSLFYWLKRLGSISVIRWPGELSKLYSGWRSSTKWATWLAQQDTDHILDTEQA